MSHWGIPGPGGSMGKCAVCGEDFAAGVVKDLCGLDSGIQEFSVGFVNDTLYAHDPDCVDAMKLAFKEGEPEKVYGKLPDGPLKECLEEALKKQTAA